MLPLPSESTHTCPQCGGPLDPTLPGGGCGACLWGDLVLGEQEARLAAGRGPEIQGYEIEEEIGRGGMGVVYRARQESSGREVALKMVAPDTLRGQEARQRFLMEVEAMAAVQHPALMPLYDAGQDAHGRPWLAMQYAAGGTLAARLAGYFRQWRLCAELLVTLARAVAYAHERGVLHRDLKPANILFDAAGHPYVADFGLAKWADEGGDLTRTASVLGSPAYLAPEAAAAGGHAATTAHDVYGLGAILYELLTGAHPYDGPSAMQVITKIIAGPPPPPRQVVPGIPRDLATITEKAMARDPARRYTSAAALADDLVLWLDGRPILARPVSAAERMLIWARRKPALAALVAVCAAGAVAFTILTQTANRRLAEESATSRTHARLAREAEGRALENGRAARRAAYVSDMYAASQSRLSGNYAAARRLLAAQVPAAGAEDLRSIEWHILTALCADDRPDSSWQMGSGVQSLTWPISGTHWWALDTEAARSWRGHGLKEEPDWSPKPATAGLGQTFTAAAALPQIWQAAEKLAAGTPFDVSSLTDFTKRTVLDGGLVNHPRDLLCAPHGGWLALATERRGVSIWNNADHSLLRVLPGSWARLCQNKDGTRLALTCADKERWDYRKGTLWHYGTFIYDTTTWQPLHYLPRTSDQVALSPDGTLLATPDGLRDVATGKIPVRFQRGGGGTFAFTPDGRHIATNNSRGMVDIYEVSTGQSVMSLPGPASSLAFSHDAQFLAVGGMDHVVRLWKWKTADPYLTCHGHESAVTALAWAPGSSSSILSGGTDGRINLWVLDRTPPPRPAVEFHSAPIDIPGTPLLGGFTGGGQFVLWDSATNTITHRIPMPPDMKGNLISPDHAMLSFICTPREGGPSRLLSYSLPTGKILRDTPLPGDLPKGSIIHNVTATHIAVLGEEGERAAYDAATGALLHRTTSHLKYVTWASLSPDATFIGEETSEGWTAYTFPRWELLWRIPALRGKIVVNHAFTQAAAAQPDGGIALYSLRDGSRTGTLTGHSGKARELTFSPDGTRLASLDNMGLRLWDIPTLREVANLGSHGEVLEMRFAADSTRLFLRMSDGTPRILPAAP